MKTIQSRVAIAMCIAATIIDLTVAGGDDDYTFGDELVDRNCALRCDPDIKATRAQLGVYIPPSVVICDVESIATVAASGDADCKACYAACSMCSAACKVTEQDVHNRVHNVDTFDLASCESDCADADAAAAVMEASDNCGRAKSLLWQANELAPYETVATCNDNCKIEKAHFFNPPLTGDNNDNAKNLEACNGECDNDAQCAAGLVCFQRDNWTEVPGCSQGGMKDWDYCTKLPVEDRPCDKFTEVCLAHKFVADVRDPYGGNVQHNDRLDEIARLARNDCMEDCTVEDGGAPCFEFTNYQWYGSEKKASNYGPVDWVIDESSFFILRPTPEPTASSEPVDDIGEAGDSTTTTIATERYYGENGYEDWYNPDEYVAVDNATNIKFRATCAVCEKKCDAVKVDIKKMDDDDVTDRYETIVDFYKKDCGSEINLEGFADCAMYRGSGIRAGTDLFFDVYDEYNKLGGRFHDRDFDFSEDDWRKEFIPRANYTDMTCPDRCDMLAKHEFYRTNFSYQIYEGTQKHVNTLCTKYDAVVQAAQGVCATTETGNCAAVLTAINASGVNEHAEFIGSSIQSSANNIQLACNLVAAMMMAACLMV